MWASNSAGTLTVVSKNISNFVIDVNDNIFFLKKYISSLYPPDCYRLHRQSALYEEEEEESEEDTYRPGSPYHDKNQCDTPSDESIYGFCSKTTRPVSVLQASSQGGQEERFSVGRRSGSECGVKSEEELHEERTKNNVNLTRLHQSFGSRSSRWGRGYLGKHQMRVAIV